MAYADQSDPDFFQNLLERKEFISLKPDHDGADVNLDPYMGKHLKIHSHQLFIRNFMNPNTKYDRLHLIHSTGTGKCHAPNTGILMADGSVRLIQHVRAGDAVMGDDGTPRRVQQVARGYGKMYRICPKYNDAFVCNDEHILTVFNMETEQMENHTIAELLEENRRNQLAMADIASSTSNTSGTTSTSTVTASTTTSATNTKNTRGIGMAKYMLIQAPVDKYYFREQASIGQQGKSSVLYFSGNRPVLRDIKEDFLATGHDMARAILQGYKGCVLPSYVLCPIRDRNLIARGFYEVLENVENVGNQLHDRILVQFSTFADMKLVAQMMRSCGYFVNTEVVQLDNYNGMCGRPTFRMTIWRQQHVLNIMPFVLEERPAGEFYGMIVDGNHRYLLDNFIITHNTIAAISVAQEFIRTYSRIWNIENDMMPASSKKFLELNMNTPTVFVFGFGGTKTAFYKELLSHPEFGYVTDEERLQLAEYKQAAQESIDENVIKTYQDYYNMLKKRITNKSQNGFYRFFGYDEFVNKLFQSEEITLHEIEAEVEQRVKAGENVRLLDTIIEYNNTNRIRINVPLLESFANSLIIADEVHNTYNTNIKNSRGVAIQLVLEHHNNVRFLSLSATPINNSPSEIVELINYLVPASEAVHKKDLFQNDRYLLPGALEKISKLTRGKVSFLQDMNIRYFPERRFLGTHIRFTKDEQKYIQSEKKDDIPYLRFVECPMSPAHQRVLLQQQIQTYISGEREFVKTSGMGDKKTLIAPFTYHSIPTDGGTLFDGVFPVPCFGGKDAGEMGTRYEYQTHKVRTALYGASDAWRKEHNVLIDRDSGEIYGAFLRQPNLGKYFSKHNSMLNAVIDVLKSAAGDIAEVKKMMIYHDRVKMSGVTLIGNVMHENGLIEMNEEPQHNTLCVVCGLAHSTRPFKFSDDAKIKEHDFLPARYAVITSKLSKTVLENTLITFNSADNVHGQKCVLIIGSRVIRESYEFKEVQEMLIASLPVNVTTLIQVFGRCVRKNSHARLPQRQRRVNISIFASTLNHSEAPFIPILEGDDSDSNVSNSDITSSDSAALKTQSYELRGVAPEVLRYLDKVNDYVTIQLIERTINSMAIDGVINRDTNITPLMNEYFPNGQNKKNKKMQPTNILGSLYFDPGYDFKEPKKLHTETFNAFAMFKEEINVIGSIVKRLFILQPVWTYQTLWDAIRSNIIHTEINPTYFDENNFIIVMQNLLNREKHQLDKEVVSEGDVLSRLFDTNDRFVYLHHAGTMGGLQKCEIQQFGEYFVRIPIRVDATTSSGEKPSPVLRPVVDIESYMRQMPQPSAKRINIAAYVENTKMNQNYATHMARLEVLALTVGDKDPEALYLAFLHKPIEFQIKYVEELIKHCWTAKSSADMFAQLDSAAKDNGKSKGDGKGKNKDNGKDIGKNKKTSERSMRYVYELLTGLDLLIPFERVNNPRLEHLFTSGRPKNVKAPVAFTRDNFTLHVYNGVGFSVVNINSIEGRILDYKSNPIIVGYMEYSNGGAKFKIRTTDKAANVITDKRLIERGTVCVTKRKVELLDIAKKLEIKDISEKTHNLCTAILLQLVRLEMAERKKGSNIQYFELWSSVN